MDYLSGFLEPGGEGKLSLQQELVESEALLSRERGRCFAERLPVLIRESSYLKEFGLGEDGLSVRSRRSSLFGRGCCSCSSAASSMVTMRSLGEM